MLSFIAWKCSKVVTQMLNRFITVEGIEGVGKSTICHTITQYLHQQNFPVIQTREPGGTPIGEAIRQVILNDYSHAMANMCELLLMFAALAQHIEQVISPALAHNQWVLSDRFSDASFAYQGAGRGIALEKISQLETLVQNDLRPGLTFLLDAPVEIALNRLLVRGKLDRIEQEKSSFFERIRLGYLQRAQSQPERYRIIDATLPLQEVQNNVKQQLQEYIQYTSRT